MFQGARHRHWQKPAEKNLLGTCAGPLAFSSRFQPSEGLMHLPLSCCEKAGTEKPLCGLAVEEGLKLLWKTSNEWPVPQTWHLNEDQAPTGRENEASELGASPLGPQHQGNHCLPNCAAPDCKREALRTALQYNNETPQGAESLAAQSHLAREEGMCSSWGTQLPTHPKHRAT